MIVYPNIPQVEVIGGSDKYIAVCRSCYYHTSPIKGLQNSPFKVCEWVRLRGCNTTSSVDQYALMTMLFLREYSIMGLSSIEGRKLESILVDAMQLYILIFNVRFIFNTYINTQYFTQTMKTLDIKCKLCSLRVNIAYYMHVEPIIIFYCSKY